MSKEPKDKTRAKTARHHEVVLACLEERLLMIPLTDELEPHRDRMIELFDEFRRSLKRKGVAPELETTA